MSSESKPTVDASRVAFHSKLKDVWWDENGILGCLHAMNAIRVPLIKYGLVNSSVDIANCEASLEGLKILDVGCGGGFVTEPLALMGATVTGIDPSAELINAAKIHGALNPVTKKIRYIEGTMEDHIKDHENYYDAVVAYEVVQHVADPELLLELCVKALKPGGSIFLSTQNQSYWTWLVAILFGEYICNSIAKGMHSYDKLIPLDQLQHMLDKNHCRVVKVTGLFYNVFTKSWFQVPFKSVSFALHAVKLSVASCHQ